MSYTLEEKLEWALAGKARWEARMAQADAAHETASQMGGGIPGFGGSGNQRAARQVRSAFESADRKWREATEKLEYYTTKARSYERRIAERDRVRYTAADLQGATHIKYGSWRKVVRVSAKSVTVESGYSWTDRVPIEQITDFRIIQAAKPEEAATWAVDPTDKEMVESHAERLDRLPLQGADAPASEDPDTPT